MRLAELFPQADLPDALAAREIKGLSADSRGVTADMVFFRVPGTKTDGLVFVPQAVQRGAVAIVAERARTALSEPPLLSKQRTCGSLWRKRPRAYTRASPKQSLRSPERAARHPSPISCGRFGPR